jgi:threonyl-tRNA synthetase
LLVTVSKNVLYVQELMVFSAQMHRLAEKKLKFERLVVDASLALEMFKDNQYKSAQVWPVSWCQCKGQLAGCTVRWF